jgi:hypothetical protein
MVFGFLKCKELRGKKLEKRAKKLGVSLLPDDFGSALPGSSAYPPPLKESELQRRVREAERDRRDRIRLIVNIISPIVSVCGAIAAWIGILKSCLR